ncbi:MAG: C25 family cysteine peptidase [Candidatus Cloacimonadaceae bacterium]
MRKIALSVMAMSAVFILWGRSLELNQKGGQEWQINFKLPSFSNYQCEEKGRQINKITLPADAEGETWAENMSGMPQVQSWLYIPEGYDAEIVLNNEAIRSYTDVDYPERDFAVDPTEWLSVSQPMSMRGNRLISICLRPFRYDHNTRVLTTLAQADIRVQFVPQKNYSSAINHLTPATASLLRSICLNKDAIRTDVQAPGSYVIFYNGTSLTGLLQPLADWKHEKGYDVHLVNVSTLGTTNADIKNYLQSAYDNWQNPPEFILICGRGTSGPNYVPTYTELFDYYMVGDYKYTLLDGTDLIPDAFIGRITFSSNDELQTAVNRILAYEKLEGVSGSNWLNKTFLVADVSTSGLSCHTTINYVKNLLLDYNPTAQLVEAYSGPFPSQINAAINSGVGMYWYRGHGDFSGWTASDINNLTNTGKYPFFCYITCFTTNFGSGNVSQAERMLRLGSPSAPRGMIGVIGASGGTHTCLNNIVTASTAFGLYKEGISQCGPAMVRGKLAVMANYPQNPANYINMYMQQINLIGDPGIDVWLKQVTEINVQTSSILYDTGGNLIVRVTQTDGTPVENAWVTLTKGASEIYVYGFTNEEGYVRLNYGSAATGTAKLTVTKPNHRPYQTNLSIVSGSPAIALQNISALQQCHAGSSISFPVTLGTNELTSLTNVQGVLQSLDDFVIVNQDSASFGNINPSSQASSNRNFQITVASDTPKGKTLFLNLHLTFDFLTYDLPFSCVENGPNIISSVDSPNNNMLTYGSNNLNLTLQNISSVTVNGLQALLECSNPSVQIQNPNQTVGTVNAAETITVQNPFVIVVSDSVQEGIPVRFKLQLYNSSCFEQSFTFTKTVGSPSTDDFTGPDSYGYVCYGPGDTNYVPYNWLETDPSLGGAGTNLYFSDVNTEGDGAVAIVNLPFQFRFYGVAYNQISICSNGFIMPGNQTSIEWMNWQIPGPLVPRPIIAPFWDDLLTDTSSKVLYYYNSNLHAEIIQWQNMKNRFNPYLRETFQVILYDPSIHFSPTGDSPILFQYKVFNNVDSGNYGVDNIDHGQYATVGIADQTGQIGICYTFNNQYPVTAQPLSAQTTLYFTTIENYQIQSEPVIFSYHLQEISGNGDNLPDAGETFNLAFVIKNIGLGSIPASQVTLTTNDPYTAILQNTAELTALPHNQTATTSPSFVIQIASGCPNQHIINFNLNISSVISSYDLHFDLMVNALHINCLNFSYTDDNNCFAEPSETGELYLTLQNVSFLEASNLNISLSSIGYATVSPALQVVDIPAQGSLPLTFTVQIFGDIAQGSLIVFTLHIYQPSGYDSTMAFSLLVGIPDVFSQTDFDDGNLYSCSAFLSGYNINLQPAQYIHSSGQEVRFLTDENIGVSFAYLNTIGINDLLAARVQFTWYSSFTSCDFSLKALYSSQSNLVTLWSSQDHTSAPRTDSFILNSIPSDAEYVTFVFVIQLNSIEPGVFVMDDVSVLTMHHARGFITGHVTLDLFPEQVENVQVRLRYSPEVYSPDAAGNFILPAYPGLNVLYATLEGYYNTVNSLNIMVQSGQTTSGADFSFQRLRAPINLTYELQANQLTLNWELEGEQRKLKANDEQGKSERFLTPNYFKIWFNWGNYHLEQITAYQTYTRMLNMSGEYHIYVRSVYLFTGSEETFSEPSDTIDFNFTLHGDETTPQPIFALMQNYPNPFTQSTRINFSLPEKSKAELCIYNLKGQKIKTLLNCEQNAGVYAFDWDGNDEQGNFVSSGIYYCKLQWHNKTLTRKMIKLR